LEALAFEICVRRALHVDESLGVADVTAFYGKDGFDLMLEPPLYRVSAMDVTGSS